jgi:hypothetical protein
MQSSAGRVQLEQALAPEAAPKSPAPREIVSAEEPETPAVAETPEGLVPKQVRRPVVRGKRLRRPPFAAEMRASTVYLPESVYAELEALANKSGKKGFKRPELSETVRAALRLVQSRQSTPANRSACVLACWLSPNASGKTKIPGRPVASPSK